MAPGQGAADGWRSRWQEWVITGAIAALLVVGVAAIWGAPIQRWIDHMGGDGSEDPAAASTRAPAGSTL